MINYIYKFIDYNDRIIYIGKTKNIKHRMQQHFSINANYKYKSKIFTGHLNDECYQNVKMILFASMDNQMNTELYETYLINKYKPKYNTDKLYLETCCTELNFKEPEWHEIYIYHDAQLKVSLNPIPIFFKEYSVLEKAQSILYTNYNICRYHQGYLNQYPELKEDYQRLSRFYNDANLFINNENQDFDYDPLTLTEKSLTRKINSEENINGGLYVNVKNEILDYYTEDYIDILKKIKFIEVDDENTKIKLLQI